MTSPKYRDCKHCKRLTKNTYFDECKLQKGVPGLGKNSEQQTKGKT